MARRQILSLSDRESLLALPEDELTLTRMAYFSEHDLALISAHLRIPLYSITDWHRSPISDSHPFDQPGT
ncbi:hypothetical protein [Escherichia coli]|uniref:hypothetical protein n=1 Tax=Escherichia coli TaxID=562 RepID=UPI00094D6A3D|nr:hypothetical protein [Escherichia coli]